MKQFRFISVVVASSLLLSSSLWAGGSGHYAGNGRSFEGSVTAAKVGDLSESYGVNAALRLNNTWRFRAGYSQFDFSNQRTLGSIQFNETLEQQNATFNVDWYPYRWLGFYTTLGAASTNGDYTLTGSPNASTTYSLQNTLYTGSQLGTLSGSVSTRDIVPYVGLGYTHYFKPHNRQGWFVQAEIGSLFALDPTLSLESSNPNNLANLPADLQATADDESSKLEDSYLLYGLSMGYRF